MVEMNWEERGGGGELKVSTSNIQETLSPSTDYLISKGTKKSHIL